MKKLFLMLLGVLVLNTISSCKKYLEVKSDSMFTEESAFSNLDFATKAVYGIYDILTSSDSYGYYYMYTKIDSDIEFSFGANEGAKFQLGHYAGDAGSARLEGMWNNWYKIIERANICLDKLPTSPLWEGAYAAEAKQLYAEAATLRALAYYELIGTWGDVPFSPQSTKAGDNFYLPKTDRDSIYEYLVDNLKEVEEYLPWMTKIGTTERVNKAFLKGLRARLALAYAGYSVRNNTFETRRGPKWQEYYKIARDETNEVIQAGTHRLNPDFQNIFKTLHAYQQDLSYGEVLFDIAFGRSKNGPLAVRNGMPFTAQDPKYGRGGGDIKVPPSYYYSFDRLDKRRNVSVELYSYSDANFLGQQRLVSSNGRNFSASKWRKSWIEPLMGGALKDVANTGINMPLMRYSDILLMHAEAENELNGPTPSAKESLSLVRKRAFPQEAWGEMVDRYIDSVSGSKESFFNAIVDERAWEFGGGELLRKFDLVRWNLLGSKIKQMKEENIKIINDDPSYASRIPYYIFWKYKEDGETIEILNPDFRINETSVPGYTRVTWLPGMSQSNIATFITNINLVANGYDASKNNHLYPIGGNIISASNGSLSNDQMPN